MADQIKFPKVNVPLVGEDGNAFAILGRVTRALRTGGATPEEIKQFQTEAASGDYDHLLQTVMEWVNVDTDLNEEDLDECEREDDEAELYDEDSEDEQDDYGYAEQKNFD